MDTASRKPHEGLKARMDEVLLRTNNGVVLLYVLVSLLFFAGVAGLLISLANWNFWLSIAPIVTVGALMKVIEQLISMRRQYLYIALMPELLAQMDDDLAQAEVVKLLAYLRSDSVSDEAPAADKEREALHERERSLSLDSQHGPSIDLNKE